MSKSKWILFGFTHILLLNSSPVVSASKLIHIYGPKQGSQLQASASTANYVLQLASFKNQHNADAYVKQQAAKTREILHIAYRPEKKALYEVYIGPLSDLNALHRVSQQLLLKEPLISQMPKRDTHSSRIKPINLNNPAWTNVLTANLGFGWNNIGEMQTILLEPDVGKAYVATDTNGSIFQGELFAGVQRQLHHNLQGQIGLAIAGATGAGMNGDIWEDADPELANYTYNYRINHSQVAVGGKLIADIDLMLMPYVNGSVGVGFNKAYNFTIRSKLEEEVPAPDFQSSTTTAFTYTVGVGVQKTLNRHWQAGIGYLFADWGKSQLAAAPEQALNTGLVQSHIYVNSILFNLSYLG